ncbi:C6 transcription factor [Fusarium bulbicola]|nr:C6 transcription factor [Fusarium bulbicola]
MGLPLETPKSPRVKDVGAESSAVPGTSQCVIIVRDWNKPGIKTGVIEGLNRRVEALENTVFDNAQAPNPAPSSDSSQIIGAFSSLIQELRGLVHNSAGALSLPPAHSSISQAQHATPGPVALSSPNDVQHQPRKRRRVDSCGNPNIELASQLNELGSTSSQLPPPELLEEVINAYFILVQPWIPILHETRFRSRFYSHEQLPCLTVLLHAIVVAAIRFVDTENGRRSEKEIETWTSRSRSIVLLSAMDGMSVENLQALSIIAFTDMGNGDMSRAWPIIGSLTRTVEYLQLSVEADDRQQGPLLKPLTSLSPSQNWTQEEERRRVFWSIFNLDRWNTSLTSDDVRRRLPADGGLWHKEETVLTPYFGIWDRSAAKMGNSIVFLPAHYPSPDQVAEAPPETPSTNTTAPKGNDTVDMTTVGAFAYWIVKKSGIGLPDLRSWTYALSSKSHLFAFKSLANSHCSWKMFLPQKWKDSNISRRPTIINMDPNLTLAHITHNTSMILLHQQIAYPSPQWTSIVRMPSAHSAETCQIAAAETATITRKYLKYTPENSPVNSQFAFCVFVSARALLVHWRFYKTDLAPEFWVLVESLDDFSKRWTGPLSRSKSNSSLPGKYSAQLRAIHKKCAEDLDYSPDVVGYSTDGFVPQTPGYLREGQSENQHSSQARAGAASGALQNSFDSGSQRSILNPGPPGSHLSFLPQISPTNPGVEHNSPDELSAISTVLMDQDFMQLDRVISFDDMMFTAQTIDDQGGPFSMNNWTLG